MEQLAHTLQSKKIEAIFIYTGEAHPGENYPHHTSFEQKMAHARAFQELTQTKRPILVDSLDGACHLAYGGMPNMSWIIDRIGRPVYKADWTDPDSLSAAIDYLLAMKKRRQSSGLPFRHFHVERLEYWPQDRPRQMEGLKRSGPKAVAEFKAQMKRWGKEINPPAKT